MTKYKDVMTGTFKGEADVFLEEEGEAIARATCDLITYQKWPDAEGFGTDTELVPGGSIYIRGSIKIISGETNLIERMFTEGKVFLFLKLSKEEIHSIIVKKEGSGYHVSSDF